MNFDPRTTKFHNQADVDEYLTRYGVCLSPGIEVKLCPQDNEFMKSLPNGGVMHPQILALRLKVSLTKFIRSVLIYYRIAPRSCRGEGAWRIVLGFEALCPLVIPNACQHGIFIVAYALRKIA